DKIVRTVNRVEAAMLFLRSPGVGAQSAPTGTARRGSDMVINKRIGVIARIGGNRGRPIEEFVHFNKFAVAVQLNLRARNVRLAIDEGARRNLKRHETLVVLPLMRQRSE